MGGRPGVPAGAGPMTAQPSAPTPPLSRTAYVTQSLRRSIVSGDLPAGAPLVEAELAARFGLSKTPVREAIRSLAGTGLVTMSEYRGVTVRVVDDAMARSVFEVRLLLEPAAVEMAVTHGIDVELARAALDRAQGAGTPADRSLANREFHRLLFATCGNPVLVGALEGLRDQTALVTVTAWRHGITWVHEAHEHEAILEAAARGDAATARRLDEEHIRSFTDNALAQLRGQDDARS